MIRVIAGGKKSAGWLETAVKEYEKRLKKPFDVKWEFFEEKKLAEKLERWDFSSDETVILTDERGENLSSPELAANLEQSFNYGKTVVVIIGGAYGVEEKVRKKANLVWSFSRLVFPHMLMRLMLIEQIYRAQEIAGGGKYHHD